MEFVLLSFICIAAFAVRAYPRMVLKNAFNSDTYYHLKCAKCIINNSYKIPLKIEQAVLPHEYTYPFGYHLVLAILPEKTRLWFERMTGAIFDTINVVILFWFTNWLISQDSEPYQIHVPILVAALYAFSPALLRIGSGPRAYNGSPRVFGQTFYLIHIVTAYHYFSTDNPYSIVISMLAGAALICSAKFGTQVFFLFGIFFTAFVTYSYIILLGGCFLLAIILSKGQAWKIVRGQVVYSVLYAKYLQQAFLFPNIVNITSLKAYITRFKCTFANTIRNRTASNFIDWYYREQYFGHQLVTVFPQYFIILEAITNIRTLSSQKHFLLIWMSAGIFWFLLTKYKYLLFLGEGERYAEYGLFPTYYLLVVDCPKELELFLYLYLAYSVGSAILFAKDYIKRNRPLHEDFTASAGLFEYLNSLPSGNILPVGWVHHQALYRSSLPVVSQGSNSDPKLFPLDDFMFYFSNYPYPPKDFNQVIIKYDVSYILAERSCLQHYLTQLSDPAIFRDSTILLAESPSLLLFKHKKRLEEKCQQLNDLIAEGKLEEAKATLEEILLFMPKDQGLISTKGIVELHLGNYEEAIKSFENLVAIDPTQIVSYIGMAQASLMMNRIDDADKYAMTAAKYEPFNQDVHDMLNEISLRRQQN